MIWTRKEVYPQCRTPGDPYEFWTCDFPLCGMVGWDSEHKRWYLCIYSSPESEPNDESSIVVAVGDDPNELKILGDRLGGTWD